PAADEATSDGTVGHPADECCPRMRGQPLSHSSEPTGERCQQCGVHVSVIEEAEQPGSGEPSGMPCSEHVRHLTSVPAGTDDDHLDRSRHGSMVPWRCAQEPSAVPLVRTSAGTGYGWLH